MSGDIGAQIRALRTERKLTQNNLALLSGISQQHLSHLERGGGGIELTTLRRILEALGHELAFVPRPPSAAAALAARARSWERVAQWEATRPPETFASLARAGALADFFLSRHGAKETELELRARAERVRAGREPLARARLGVP